MTRAAFVVMAPRVTALRALNYSRESERLRRAVGSRTSTPLGELLDGFGSNYGKVFTRHDCSPVHGVELLSQSDMFAAEPEGRVIRIDSFPDPKQHEIHRNDVLIAGAGTLGETELFGRSLLADGRLTHKYVGPHAMVLRLADAGSDHALFVYAFLCTRVGVRAIRAASYGTKVLGLRTSMLRELPIPNVDANVMSRVAAGVRAAVAGRERFAAELTLARTPIEKLPEVLRAHEACAERVARASSYVPPFPTLNAWNFASTGGAITLLRKKWSASLGDIVSAHGIFSGPRFTRIACESPFGVDMLTQRDIFLVRSIPQRIVYPAGVPAEQLFPPANALLLAGVGTLGEGEIFGRVVFASDEMSRQALTGDVLRIVPTAEHSDVTYAFLSTAIGRRLLRSTAAGTKLLRMRHDLLRQLPIPAVDTDVAATVSNHVRAAVKARDTAKSAEADAVRLIESEVLPEWLN